LVVRDDKKEDICVDPLEISVNPNLQGNFMVKPVPCQSCNGLGCRICNYIGFFGTDGREEYLLDRDRSGNVFVAGLRQRSGGSNVLGKLLGLIFGHMGKSLEEPHDFIWEVKQKK
jgi:hypothetical protein